MSDLISRQAAIEFCEWLINADKILSEPGIYSRNVYAETRISQTELIMGYIEDAPSAEPKKGRWIDMDDHVM